MTNRRVLGPAEAGMMTGVGLVLLGLAVAAAVWPYAVALPLAVLGVWMAVSFLARAKELRAQRSRDAEEDDGAGPSGPRRF